MCLWFLIGLLAKRVAKELKNHQVVLLVLIIATVLILMLVLQDTDACVEKGFMGIHILVQAAQVLFCFFVVYFGELVYVFVSVDK